jgi:hypothetical protein
MAALEQAQVLGGASLPAATPAAAAAWATLRRQRQVQSAAGRQADGQESAHIADAASCAAPPLQDASMDDEAAQGMLIHCPTACALTILAPD